MDKIKTRELLGEVISGSIFDKGCEVCGKESTHSFDWAPMCREHYVAKWATAKHKKRLEMMTERIQGSNIPRRLEGAIFDSYVSQDNETDEAVQTIKNFVESDVTLLLLIGNHGSGKSHLSISALKVYAQRGQVYYITATKIENSIREYNNAVKDLLRETDFLVIDELGREAGTDFVLSQISEIIYDRYDNLKKTLLISNMGIEELDNSPLYNAIKDRVEVRVTLETEQSWRGRK